MNTRHNTGTPTPSSTGPESRSAGEASGKHQGLRRPIDDVRIEDALDNIGLEDRGALLEDHLRDRRSKGVAGAYDDSIEHDADEQPPIIPRRTGATDSAGAAANPRKTDDHAADTRPAGKPVGNKDGSAG